MSDATRRAPQRATKSAPRRAPRTATKSAPRMQKRQQSQGRGPPPASTTRQQSPEAEEYYAEAAQIPASFDAQLREETRVDIVGNRFDSRLSLTFTEAVPIEGPIHHDQLIDLLTVPHLGPRLDPPHMYRPGPEGLPDKCRHYVPPCESEYAVVFREIVGEYNGPWNFPDPCYKCEHDHISQVIRTIDFSRAIKKGRDLLLHNRNQQAKMIALRIKYQKLSEEPETEENEAMMLQLNKEHTEEGTRPPPYWVERGVPTNKELGTFINDIMTMWQQRWERRWEDMRSDFRVPYDWRYIHIGIIDVLKELYGAEFPDLFGRGELIEPSRRRNLGRSVLMTFEAVAEVRNWFYTTVEENLRKDRAILTEGLKPEEIDQQKVKIIDQVTQATVWLKQMYEDAAQKRTKELERQQKLDVVDAEDREYVERSTRDMSLASMGRWLTWFWLGPDGDDEKKGGDEEEGDVRQRMLAEIAPEDRAYVERSTRNMSLASMRRWLRWFNAGPPSFPPSPTSSSSFSYSSSDEDDDSEHGDEAEGWDEQEGEVWDEGEDEDEGEGEDEEEGEVEEEDSDEEDGQRMMEAWTPAQRRYAARFTRYWSPTAARRWLRWYDYGREQLAADPNPDSDEDDSDEDDNDKGDDGAYEDEEEGKDEEEDEDVGEDEDAMDVD